MDDFDKQKTIPYIPSEEAPALVELPEKIGPYKIDSLLDRGGMSILYLSTHPETHAPIVIKVLEPKFLSRPEVVQRFIHETQMIGLPDHPNIVKLFSHGEWEGGLYIAMEFIQGISLRQLLLKSHISLRRALEIVIDISYALCHLHTHGIIHRDLKPENVLITNTGRIKVIDFGIAQLLTEQPDPKAPARQHIIGTPIYMSPEQRENPDSVSYPSDIYALGIITYELVLGKLSYGQIHLGLVPKGLKPILHKALQQYPDDRYQDVVDFIADVTVYLESEVFTEEAKPSDQINELSEGFERAEASLHPENTPDWPKLSLEIIPNRGSFYDFHSFGDNRYGIILGSCREKITESIFYTAIVCGMARTLTKLEHPPAEWLSLLNNMLIEDRIKQSFLLSYLLIDLEKNEFHYAGSDQGSLWLFREGEFEPFPLDNPPLGKEQDAVFQVAVKPLNPEEALVLTSGDPSECASQLKSLFKNKSKDHSPFTIITISSKKD